MPLIVHTRHGRDIQATARQTMITRYLSKLVDRFVCVSEEVAALSREQGMACSSPRTIRNGIDTDRFRFGGPDPDGLRRDGGAAQPREGRRQPGPRDCDRREAGSRSAGRGRRRRPLPGGLAGRLAGELDVSDRITFLGEVRDVPAVLARARMFVLPSRSEGIPLTALEAMACGVPVVATRVGGLPEVVQDGVTGLLVPPADPAALANAMVEIWHDPDRGDRMGRAGRRRAEERFDVRRMVAQYEALYLEKRSKSGRWSDPGFKTAGMTDAQPVGSSIAVE